MSWNPFDDHPIRGVDDAAGIDPQLISGPVALYQAQQENGVRTLPVRQPEFVFLTPLL